MVLIVLVPRVIVGMILCGWQLSCSQLVPSGLTYPMLSGLELGKILKRGGVFGFMSESYWVSGAQSDDEEGEEEERRERKAWKRK